MSDQPALRAVAEGVMTITLNRPDVLNSCTREMVGALRAAFSAAAADPAVRAVLLTGAGRAFCAGQDLAEAMPPAPEPAPDIADLVEGYNGLIRAMRALEKPVVAAVNGVAAGAGANIALACDIVLAAESASFIQAFAKIGLVPDNGGTFFLPRLVGMARATSLAMLADKVTATQAAEWGMIYKAVPAGALMAEARELAARLATQPTRGLGLIKRALNASLTNGLDAQLDVERDLQREAGRTADYAEGVRAFQEKRAPRFVGG
ncbi:MAG: 1,2-epoxyphenylacetyl-CoA isomerase [uncultured Gemmatimonadaceae bacterium]|uniref:1,2-epoxyphenylacetyl-CoA isomerase n=1 Tax=uncultured Gemmatimonadaceae bacterium TaxID=246130 RepID=A0A6J4KWB3_9BACT|nr:MAG: 1,2-epoxyphenylacetyl-CoA isomerase [uncultured Gemmatimonadaceae bacterium]